MNIGFISLFSLLTTTMFGTTIQSSICQPVSPPVFSTQAATTASSTYVIAGSTSQAIAVDINDNGQYVANTTSDSSGHFSLQVSLVAGGNSFTAVGSNGCTTSTSPTPLVITMTTPIVVPTTDPTTTSGSSTASTPTSTSTTVASTENTTDTSVTTDTTTDPTQPTVIANPSASSSPSLIVTLPDGTTLTATGSTDTTGPTVKTTDIAVYLKGTTDPNAVVSFMNNGKTVATVTAANDGSFGVSIPLDNGKNVLSVEATQNSQSTKQTITFIRDSAINPLVIAAYSIGVILLLVFIALLIRRFVIKKGANS